MDVQKTVTVGMGKFHVTRDASLVLAAYGLGSCVGISAYDPVVKAGGLAHIMLPCSKEAGCRNPGFRFADVAIPAMIAELVGLGAIPRRLVCTIAGGAKVLYPRCGSSAFRVGDRNVQAAVEALQTYGITPSAVDTGGTRGRRLRLFMDTGRVFVKVIGHEEVEL